MHKDASRISALRQTIRDFYIMNEEKAVDAILPVAEVSPQARTQAWERARNMVLRIRKQQQGQGGVDALLREYSLSSEEGVVLMCLAEALLRVPDTRTQDELIRDKLSQGHWSPHLGNSDSLFVNASSWGLLLTGNLVSYSDKRNKAQFSLLKLTLGRISEPVIRRAMNIAMRVMGKQFVMGETIQDAVKRAAQKEAKGYVFSYDMLGEGARTMEDAERYFTAYRDAIQVIGQAAKARGPRLSPGISVKLSALHPRYHWTHKDRVLAELPIKLKALCLKAKQYDIGLTVDAEEAARLDLSLDVFEAVFRDPALSGWDGFGLAVQAYQKRALAVIEWVRELSLQVSRRIMVRLVKGAYWDSEVKLSQQAGVQDFPVYTRKSSTDVSYHSCANKLMAYRDSIYPQFATHNAYTAAVIIEMAGDDNQGYEFQCLHGMGDTLYDQVVSEAQVQCRIYAPVGVHEDLLAYLVRRLLENGANSSFVNAIVDTEKPVESLLDDPVERTYRLRNKANPNIANPEALYAPTRRNAKGLDLNDSNAYQALTKSLVKWTSHYQLASSSVPANAIAVLNPADHFDTVGYHVYDQEADMQVKLDCVSEGFVHWSKVPVAERSAIANRIADSLEVHMHELIALCLREAGKTMQDSIDEVREAVDFCRYYAAQAQHLAVDSALQPRGVVFAVSPWNFPLAIFLGQVIAALVTGNTVLAKPAEQTSLIALRALELMQQCGVPKNALALIVASGKGVAELLLPDPRIKGVMFTGSTKTGALIARTLAQRNSHQVPLIAETGGQNCMIVDSTALPEQVVDDVIQSGFQSAGQRCSALRVLFLQDSIADDVINMLKGAMRELNIGNPKWLATDVGPIIDERALCSLLAHEAKMKDKAKLLYQCPLPKVCDKGAYFPPTLYEIDDIQQLKKEVFGPVVHVVRFAASSINRVVDSINNSGFGLTMGVHSRIEERALRLASQSRAGNIYINRNMIGAIVGVQPFGGRGLSGTGPKAGGPLYLRQLMVEKALQEQLSSPPATAYTIPTTVVSNKKVDTTISRASKAEGLWRCVSHNQRLSIARQLLAKIAKSELANDNHANFNQMLAELREQLTKIDHHLKAPHQLPGPTGESNKLYFEPRGVVLCLIDQSTKIDFLLTSVITALATGNPVIAVVRSSLRDVANMCADELVQMAAPAHLLQVLSVDYLRAILLRGDISGVIAHPSTPYAGGLSAMLANREGAILPVISVHQSENMIMRLVTEKTISIDTTASGGNTALMTLQDNDD